MRFKKVFAGILVACTIMTSTVYANEVVTDNTGTHFIKNDGTMAISSWVEITGKWFFFDVNGNIEKMSEEEPDDGYYKIYTSYVPYSTSDLTTLYNDIANGYVVVIDGEYYATPDYATMIANPNVVYYNDINPTELVDRTSFRDICENLE